jgi:hypothetical protein
MRKIYSRKCIDFVAIHILGTREEMARNSLGGTIILQDIIGSITNISIVLLLFSSMDFYFRGAIVVSFVLFESRNFSEYFRSIEVNS